MSWTRARDSAGAEAACLHGLAKVDPVDELHEEKAEGAGRPKIEDGDNVRVIEPGEDAGLAVEAFLEGGVGCPRSWPEDLQGDEAVELGLAHLVNRAHAAGPDQFEDLEVRELRRHLGDFGRRRPRGRGTGRFRDGCGGGQHALRTESLRGVFGERSAAFRTG